MILSAKKITGFLIIGFALVVALADAARASEQAFTNYNCAFTPPEGWSVLKMPKQAIFTTAFANSNKTSIVMLQVDDKHKLFHDLNDNFIASFEKGLESSGLGKRTLWKYLQVEGIKTYERQSDTVLSGRPASTILRILPAGGKLYTVQGLRFDGDVTEQPEIQTCFASFRLLSPPGPMSANDQAYQIGYMLGRSMVVIFVIAIIGGVIIGVVVLIKKSKNRSQAGNPPPLPPSN